LPRTQHGLDVLKAVDLKAIIAGLLALDSEAIDLDAIGEAIGDRAVSVDEIDQIIGTLEASGRRVGAHETNPPSETLVRVVRAARELRTTLGRVPTSAEIAAHAQLEVAAVCGALLFVRVMQR
jgi:hypothetical protein